MTSGGRVVGDAAGRGMGSGAGACVPAGRVGVGVLTGLPFGVSFEGGADGVGAASGGAARGGGGFAGRHASVEWQSVHFFWNVACSGKVLES